ncbi:MAG: DNA-binding protein [Lachnospiraceae bacterium]|nr:DNA-binding protein [Lachnospiraceae bacterium]
MFDYISVREAAGKWEISERRVQKLCEEERINGVMRFGHSWMIPRDAEKPYDMRLKSRRK